MNKSAKTGSGMWIIIAVLAIVFIMSPTGQEYLSGIGGAPAEDGEDVITYREVGNSATVYVDAYTGTWGGASTKTEVAPAYTILDDAGQVIVSDTTADSLTTYVGETLDFYGTGASYYMDPVLGFDVESAAPRKEFQVYEVATTANMDIVVYDETGSTALTADDNANNTADYNGGALGSGEIYPYYAKFETKVADKTFRLGAICTYYCGGEIDDFTLEESGWTETSVPNGVMTDTFFMYDDTNASTACSYKRCYVPTADFIELNEWDDIKYQFVIDTDDSTGPSANGDSYCGAVFLDYACELDSTGDVLCDWYKHDVNNDPGAIGLDENPESAGYNGLDVGFGIEPQ